MHLKSKYFPIASVDREKLGYHSDMHCMAFALKGKVLKSVKKVISTRSLALRNALCHAFALIMLCTRSQIHSFPYRSRSGQLGFIAAPQPVFDQPCSGVIHIQISYGKMSGHQSCKSYCFFFLFVSEIPSYDFYCAYLERHSIIFFCELSVIVLYKIFKNTGY